MNRRELRDLAASDKTRYREVYRGKGNWDVYDMTPAAGSVCDSRYGLYIGTYWVS
jgi:hypothetical protein